MPDDTPRGPDRLQLVTFELAGETFGVDVLLVQEIIRMAPVTRVPQSAPDVEGIINLRGRIVPVVDLRTRFGIERAEPTDQSRVVVLDLGGRVLGFTVDRVREVLVLDADAVEPAPEAITDNHGAYIEGVANLDDRLLIVLSLPRMFDRVEALPGADAA